LSNKQGGHELLDLRTGAMITHRNVSPLPMTQDGINLVHAMADQDKMPTDLKITTKAGIVLHDTASIAGVYDNSDIHEEEDEEVDDEFDDEMNPNDIGELFYRKFRNDLEQIGFKVNDYDPCVANESVNGTQHTVNWHVVNVQSSHKEFKVNNRFYEWLESIYGDSKIGPVKAMQGKIHECLAMKLDYSTPGVVKVNMTD
jgi:hypothetical protein